ncbi:hypothetical protein COT60_04020 [Candidatus Pacearchaeota archaeon CG09_land_8_20_14_0_10_30_9]|nr:hypothetical protein [Candidatus Pacearchaeota archaeon]OIO40916.1 MAG: hypothetical protein AUJ61_00885 [Candidatus Pacearchaeota archaeon CG1_02_30_18]PIN71596.1 MAG: hypothetical protein COV77_01070 [Candidatus Pacearchaeota archaeon CG11_big_fil_rev_8_21_14_0_20_30_13]PIO00761.1 MAG: hypothetical protein COT60_04020 [Candidatus Pacearchaeota archaeon CG09_land_8_20_14_0_10_30_9]PIZ81658.1 MAG: hypothetical protein COX98_03145 [Candidatus Pacearchaeota archaeon CG_4_10_14_0_2_um_filter_30
MVLEDYLPSNSIEREIYQKVLSEKELSKEEAGLIGRDGDSHGDYPYRYAFLKSDALGGNGTNSVVFAISRKESNLVGKFPWNPKDWWKVQRGQIMQEKAYKMGVKVAKPEGLYKVFNLDTKKFYSGFVMEHLGMLPLNEIRKLKESICKDGRGDFNSELKEKIRKAGITTKALHDKALEEYENAKLWAELNGFSKIDYRETNAFWVPELDDIRMIDCDEWDHLPRN